MKDKLVNFLLIFLTVFVILSFFDDSSKKTSIKESLIVTATEEDYTVPATVKINIQNNTSKEVKLNTCDLKIKSIA
jgi:hypothetical protein